METENADELTEHTIRASEMSFYDTTCGLFSCGCSYSLRVVVIARVTIPTSPSIALKLVLLSPGRVDQITSEGFRMPLWRRFGTRMLMLCHVEPKESFVYLMVE